MSTIETERLDVPKLLEHSRNGDAESFSLLCEHFQDRVIRQAVALCRDETQAQDLTQETLLEAWRSITRYNGQCQFQTWLCSILLHRFKSSLRKRRWRALLSSFTLHDQESQMANIPDQRPGPDIAAGMSETAQAILSTLDRLPSRQREVLFLRFYADESLEGIAAALECSVGTVKSRMHHALQNLRRLNEYKKENQ